MECHMYDNILLVTALINLTTASLSLAFWYLSRTEGKK